MCRSEDCDREEFDALVVEITALAPHHDETAENHLEYCQKMRALSTDCEQLWRSDSFASGGPVVELAADDCLDDGIATLSQQRDPDMASTTWDGDGETSGCAPEDEDCVKTTQIFDRVSHVDPDSTVPAASTDGLGDSFAAGALVGGGGVLLVGATL
eukprot:COSAG06_NODE_6059_length_3131_cov_3.507256_5_plen_157_part_00